MSYLSKYKGYGNILNSFELLEMFSLIVVQHNGKWKQEMGKEVGDESGKVGGVESARGMRRGGGKEVEMYIGEKD